MKPMVGNLRNGIRMSILIQGYLRYVYFHTSIKSLALRGFLHESLMITLQQQCNHWHCLMRPPSPLCLSAIDTDESTLQRATLNLQPACGSFPASRGGHDSEYPRLGRVVLYKVPDLCVSNHALP